MFVIGCVRRVYNNKSALAHTETKTLGQSSFNKKLRNYSIEPVRVKGTNESQYTAAAAIQPIYVVY